MTTDAYFGVKLESPQTHLCLSTVSVYEPRDCITGSAVLFVTQSFNVPFPLCFILSVSAHAGSVSDPAPPRHLQESPPRAAHLHFFRPRLLLRHRQLGAALHGQAGATPVLHLAGRCPDDPHPHSPLANNTSAVPSQPGNKG